MKKIISLGLLLLALPSLPSCKKDDAQEKTEPAYRNPVLQKDAPDPTVIRVPDGSFYLYSTNIPIYRSTDLVHWSFVGTAFTDATRPTFEPDGGLWAPDINYINEKYVLYYSMSVWGGGATCGIGVAVADAPQGPFTDRGALFRSNTIGVHNSIDPFYIEDDGKKYLFWGSFCGIYGIELEDDGLSLKADAEKFRIAGGPSSDFNINSIEGTYIHKRDGYYYCFGSTGSCCEGANSTYRVVVGRSENLRGPYVDKEGHSMLDDNFEVVLQSGVTFVGPGHNSEIITDDEGNDWMLYHAYVRNNTSANRMVCLDKIVWTDGWPAVAGLESSKKSAMPVFK